MKTFSLLLFKQNKQSIINKLKFKLFTENINVDSTNNLKNNKNQKTEEKISRKPIYNFYSLKSKKLGEPNINSIMDNSKFTNNNVTFNVKSKKKETTFGRMKISYEEAKIIYDKVKNKNNKGLKGYEIRLSNDKIFLKEIEDEINRRNELEINKKTQDNNVIPYSPRLGPYEVDFKGCIEEKSFHWCSCGLSLKQPFCDRSHKTTKFKPINFKLAEESKKLYFCGCKLSKEAPFCDKKTCVELAKREDKEINELI